MEPEKKQQETEGQKETKTQEAKPQPEATEPKKEARAVVEKQTNCLNCNKQIKRVRRYYRDGKYYCNKRCWNDFLKKSKEPEQKS